jgi:hypothetical protein
MKIERQAARHRNWGLLRNRGLRPSTMKNNYNRSGAESGDFPGEIAGLVNGRPTPEMRAIF